MYVFKWTIERMVDETSKGIKKIIPRITGSDGEASPPAALNARRGQLFVNSLPKCPKTAY